MADNKSARQKAAELHAAERRDDYVRALETEKTGLKRRADGSTNEDEKKRLDDRVKQVDAEIARAKKAPAGRSSGNGQTQA